MPMNDFSDFPSMWTFFGGVWPTGNRTFVLPAILIPRARSEQEFAAIRRLHRGAAERG